MSEKDQEQFMKDTPVEGAPQFDVAAISVWVKPRDRLVCFSNLPIVIICPPHLLLSTIIIDFYAPK